MTGPSEMPGPQRVSRMLFRRIAFIGVVLAAISAGVIQIRLMSAATSREIHVMEAEYRDLQRRLWQQEMELARLRSPQRIAERLASTDTQFIAPGPGRPGEPQPADTPTPQTASADASPRGAASSIPTNPAALNRHPGGSTRSWHDQPSGSRPRRQAR